MKKTVKNIIAAFLIIALIASQLSSFHPIVVQAGIQKPTISTTEKTLYMGQDSYKIIISNLVSNAKLTFSSINQTVAAVSSNGVIKPIAVGKAEIAITVKQNEKEYSLKVSVTVKEKGIKIVPASVDISTGKTIKVSLEGYSGKTTWTSSDIYIAEVDNNGVVTGKQKAGNVIITAKTSNKTFTCKIKNSTVMRDITAKQLVSEIKIGTNFASVLDYIDFNYKRGYNDYNKSSSEVGIMFTIWEPGKIIIILTKESVCVKETQFISQYH